jgi:uncharacterized protein Yka (UPF0111/DUF47 family)
MKTAIVRQIGVSGLELPGQVAAALQANDRAKFRLTVLQLARAHAKDPSRPVPDLEAERPNSGLADFSPGQMIRAAREAAGGYDIPGAAALLARLAADIATMAAPLGAEFAGRAEALGAQLSSSGDVLSGAFIDRLTKAGAADGAHQLVMDMHKALNRLQAQLAEERIDGVAAYRIEPGDRALIEAFASGLNRTAPLKFGHPGLATTATRIGGRLVLQNDIGTTDAHVLVVEVEPASVRVTYSDVHPERLAFFQGLFEGSGIAWSAGEGGSLKGAAGEETYTLSVGTFHAADTAALTGFLERLGSRLVFLIDWNKARKQLRDFLTPPQRLKLLRWAADNDIGHRGFLELGGARLINDAIETTALGIIHFGDRLHDVLGEPAAYDYLEFCFKVATEAMLAHQSPALVRDRVRAELAARLNASGSRLTAATAEHAAVIFELASSVHKGLLDLADGAGGSDRLAARAKAWEHRADELVVETRQLVRKRRDHEPFCRVIEAADDAADALEEAAFLLSLSGSVAMPARPLQELEALAALVVLACQEWVKAVSQVDDVRGLGTQEDTAAFLTAVDRIAALEHETDDGERSVIASVLKHALDFRQLHLVTTIGDRLESTVDALRWASLILRDQVLSDVLA